jgi:hypothetical protein
MAVIIIIAVALGFPIEGGESSVVNGGSVSAIDCTYATRFA